MCILYTFFAKQMQMTPSTIKNIFLIVITVICCWLLFGKCQSDASTVQAIQERDSALAVKEIVSKSYIDAQLNIQNILSELDTTKQAFIILSKIQRQTESTVKQEQSRADKYVALYRQAKADNNIPQQLANCDTIVDQYGKLKTLYTDANNNCNAAIFNQSRQIFQLDSIRAIQQRQLAGMKGALDLLGATIKKGNAALKKPWVKGYVGLEGDMGKDFGGGPSLLFEFRNGMVISMAGKLIGGQQVYEAGLHKLISFKRK